MTVADTFPRLFRQWRTTRNLSQLALASSAGISQRHISWLESGRSKPSREMVLRLAEALNVPLRARNVLLTAAGLGHSIGNRQWRPRTWPPWRTHCGRC